MFLCFSLGRLSSLTFSVRQTGSPPILDTTDLHRFKGGSPHRKVNRPVFAEAQEGMRACHQDNPFARPVVLQYTSPVMTNAHERFPPVRRTRHGKHQEEPDRPHC